jgi:hypothetical protein
MNAFSRAAATAVIVLAATASAVVAQPTSPPYGPTPSATRHVVSANPFGLLFGLFNAEYERTVNDPLTVGAGGSFFEDGDNDYVNADLFVRYYPSGRPLDGWAFGVKAGLTNVGSGTYPGVGVDVNWSRVMGRRDNFYLGIGFGLKRLLGADGSYVVPLVPTIRLVNIGVAF